MKSIKGTLILLLTAFIWGTAFVAQTAAADSVEPFTFNAARSIVAAIFLAIVLLIRSLFKKENPFKVFGRAEVIGGIICGALLFISANLQQAGIGSYPAEAAASGRSGFLTATYVVMVALASFFMGKKPHWLVFISVFGCLGGMYMLCLSNGIDRLYFGDLLVLLCAVGYTFYILVVDKYSGSDGIVLSLVQFAVCFVLSAACALMFESPNMSTLAQQWIPIMYAGVFSSGIAYTLQIVGQKFAEPTVATIVMSLESVFAALAGWVLLSEQLSPNELVGCALVFASVILAQTPELIKKKA